MKGFSFETFEVSPGNREAHDYCRRVALIEEMGPSLVLLLGPEGCGKSHLLWSVAKQVRLSTIPVGLALVTPIDFPEKVRSLVEDSRPLQGRRAVLMIDNLEGFDIDARRLEAVIDTFLAHQHPVIVASNVQPNRLHKLSGPLRTRFARSRSIIMEPWVPGGEAKQDVLGQVAALESANQILTGERDALQQRSESLQQERDALLQRIGYVLQERDMLSQHNESLQVERAAFQEQCQALLPERDWLKQKCESLERERTAFQEAVTAASKAAVEQTAAQAALENLLKESRADADYALAQQVRLQAGLSVAKAELEEAEAVRVTLAERDQALSKAEVCVGQALARLEQMRESYADWREEIMADLAAMVGELSVDRSAPAPHEPPLLRALAEAGADQEQVRAALNATRERLKAIEFEWAKTRKVLAIQTAEMDALRYAAASQVASANIQAGELEHQIDTLETALTQADAAAVAATDFLDGDGAGVGTLRAALNQLVIQLRALRSTRTAQDVERQRAQVELSLFESEYFEALPDDFQGHSGAASHPRLPGMEPGLKEALEGALTARPASTASDEAAEQTE